MTRTIQITALPDDEAHPDLVIAAIEASVARLGGAKLVAYWTDISAGLGDAELAVRVTARLEPDIALGAVEQLVDDELRRRQLRCTVAVQVSERSPVSDDIPTLHTVRDDVRRLVHLIPRGRVTTVVAISNWMDTDVDRVASTLSEIAAGAQRAVPWHRITAADGRLDTLHDASWSCLQSARLESDGVPVRHGCVVGFGDRFIDVVLLSESSTRKR